MRLSPLQYEPLLRAALDEDLGRAGDVTTLATIPPQARATAVIAARESGVIAGLPLAAGAFRLVDPAISVTPLVADGAHVSPGDVIARIDGPAPGMLSAERVALNFLGRLSGVASLTARYAEKIAHTKARVCDTRKTTPLLRTLEKYAVRCGGGANHRFGLDDAVLIKDNHIAAAGSLTKAVQLCRLAAPHTAKIEVEAKTMAEVREACRAGAGVILLDNMTPAQVRAAVMIIAGSATVEVSGGVRYETLLDYALPGVDVISIGALTHSALAVDLSLDIRPARRSRRK